MYSKCGSLRDAQAAFDKMDSHDTVSWTSLMLGYTQNGEEQTALQIFLRMTDDFSPDAHAYAIALKACTNLTGREEGRIKFSALEKGMALHSLAASQGLDLQLYVGSSLVDMYSKAGSMEDAWRVFEKLPERNVVTWTSLISGYADDDQGEAALEIFTKMTEVVKANSQTVVAVLKACTSLSSKETGEAVEEEESSIKLVSLERAFFVHSLASRGGLANDVFVSNTLIDLYAKCGLMSDSEAVFSRMNSRTSVSWNALMLGYVNNQRAEEALKVFERMKLLSKCKPDSHSFVTILSACGSLGALETGKLIHAEMCTEMDPELELVVLNSLVDLYGRCGSLEAAQLVLDSAARSDVVSFTALLTGYSRWGVIHRVFHVFKSMLEEDVRPNGVTFLSVLTACSHAGLVERGKEYFESMTRTFGLIPELEHFHCMIDMLGRGNQVDKAMRMAEKMPFDGDSVTWLTVLGGARKWKNIVAGETAFGNLVRGGKSESSSYVLMANLYGSLGMLEEKSQIEKMKNNVVRKNGRAGQSWWTDRCGVVHRFQNLFKAEFPLVGG